MSSLERRVPADPPGSHRPYLVVAREERQTKAGAPFLLLQLRGEDLRDLEGKVWSGEASLFPLFVAGAVVALVAQEDSYQGRSSLVIKDAQRSPLTADHFVRRTHLDVEALWAGLRARVDAMDEPITRRVSQALMDRANFEAAFKRAPAAKKMHNNWVGGLIEHVHSLCALADGVVAHYQATFDAPISRDKVLFGLIFHDAGKIREYDLDAPDFEFTASGRFAPHIVMGPAWVYHAAKTLPGLYLEPDFELEVAHLMHILAAHHGKEEWGSPVKPASLEALLVHHLDNLDAKVLHALELVRGKPGPTERFSVSSFADRTVYFQPQSPASAPRKPAAGDFEALAERDQA